MRARLTTTSGHRGTRHDRRQTSTDRPDSQTATDIGNAQLADAPPAGDWAAYGRDNAATRFSPLDQINPDNVDKLEQAFVYRTGDWASSMVALDVNTGLPAWQFQTSHMDVWDYDPGSQPSLIDLPGDDGNVPALAMPTKQGSIYSVRPP